MAKFVFLISGGPQQLLSSIALLQQLDRGDDVAGVLSYVGGDRRIVDFEKYVCRCFGYKYLGSIENLKDEISEVCIGSLGQLIKSFFRKDLVGEIRLWLHGKGFASLLHCSTLVMPYRKNLVSDNILLNSVAPQEVLFVPDGAYLSLNKNIAKRIFFKMFGVENFLKKGICKFYLPPYLASQEMIPFDVNSLYVESLQNVYDVLRSNVLEVIEENCIDLLHKPVSVLVWQNLFPKFFSDKDYYLSFFSKVIDSELEISPYLLIVKPHPRSTPLEIEELKKSLPSNALARVHLVEDDVLIACPVEVFYGCLDIKRMVGVASTALISFKGYDGIDIGFYTSSRFSNKLQSEIKRVASVVQSDLITL